MPFHRELYRAEGFNITDSGWKKSTTSIASFTSLISTTTSFRSTTTHPRIQNPPAGTIVTGLLNPQGMCVDSNRVYIANTGNENVVGYDYGSFKPAVTLNNSGEYPVGCAVDPETGNIAASDIFSTGHGSGAVTIWTGGSSNGTTYVRPGGLAKCLFIGYDSWAICTLTDSIPPVTSAWLTCPPAVRRGKL